MPSSSLPHSWCAQKWRTIRNVWQGWCWQSSSFIASLWTQKEECPANNVTIDGRALDPLWDEVNLMSLKSWTYNWLSTSRNKKVLQLKLECLNNKLHQISRIIFSHWLCVYEMLCKYTPSTGGCWLQSGTITTWHGDTNPRPEGWHLNYNHLNKIWKRT